MFTSFITRIKTGLAKVGNEVSLLAFFSFGCIDFDYNFFSFYYLQPIEPSNRFSQGMQQVHRMAFLNITFWKFIQF